MQALQSLLFPEVTHNTDAFSCSYPACPLSDNHTEPILPGEQHFAPVFTPLVLGNISQSLASGSAALHNLMSQAVNEAPSCKGQYPVVIFAPTAGGQRQAYTQAASELASLGHVVITVDYPFLSGAVEGELDGGVQLGTFGDWIKTNEALLIQANDLNFVYNQLVNKEQPLHGLQFWDNDTTVQLDACIFGHGTGGKVAQVMVENHVVKCGGPLEGYLKLPAPLNRKKTAAKSGSTVRKHRPSVLPSAPPSASPGTSQASLNLSPPNMGGAIQLLKHLRDSALETFGLLVCGVQGTCGNQNPSKRAPAQKRDVVDDPWYYPEKPYPKDPCYDDDYDYEDDDDEHYSGCYDDKWDGDYDDHYGDDYDDCDDPCEDDYDYDDPCEDYDPCDRYNRPYRPSKPFPPPGIFPPNITWPPYGDGKIPDYNRPWDDQWDDYHNHGGDYGRKYGHKDCDYYDGCYDDGYGGDYDDDYPCDHRPDHYREWDRKHHCHGHVDDHEDDDYDDDEDYDDDYDGHDEEDYDEDYDEDDDDYDGEEDEDYDDYDEDGHEDEYDDYDDCPKKHHHHGHVDDHHEEDYGDDHGYVDDWDDEDRA